jgi:hypothetical protein
MELWEFSSMPFDGEITDDKIVCQNCGWSWDVEDGGNDLFVCHKCNSDNSKFYLPNSNFEGADPVTAIAGAVGSLANLGGSIAQSKASKQLSKSDLQKEVDARCGKDKSRAIRKKVKAQYLECKKNALTSLDTDKKASSDEKKKAQETQKEFQQKYLIEQAKQKRTQTYIVIGIISVILGIVIYKKMKK